MQKKDIKVWIVDYVEGTPAGDFILHGTDHYGTTRIAFTVNPALMAELADYYIKTGHAGHAIWHRNNPDIPIPCPSCSTKR